MTQPESNGNKSDENTAEPDQPSSSESETMDQQGPGCMPAVLAAGALMGIAGFITCALLTWVIFQKRTELAVRTLEGSFLPQIEQSLLDPETKQEVIQEVDTLVEKMKSGRYENWQSAGIMQRLQKLPVIQWGELQALEQWINASNPEDLSSNEKSVAISEINRLRVAIKQGKAFSFDLENVLEPIRVPSSSSATGFIPKTPIDRASAMEAVKLAKLLADRSGIGNADNQSVSISKIIRAEIQEAEQAEQ
ncbi:MAG: hypothetical protein ACPHL6_11140 [Rubripirellula sp.]